MCILINLYEIHFFLKNVILEWGYVYLQNQLYTWVKLAVAQLDFVKLAGSTPSRQ